MIKAISQQCTPPAAYRLALGFFQSFFLVEFWDGDDGDVHIKRISGFQGQSNFEPHNVYLWYDCKKVTGGIYWTYNITGQPMGSTSNVSGSYFQGV